MRRMAICTRSLLLFGLAFVTINAQAVDLGTAAQFAVLGASAVTNTGASVLNGDLGIYPGTALSGFPPGVVNGDTHNADAVAQTAQNDATAAYNVAAALPYPAGNDLTGQDLGGQTLVPGVYHYDTSAGLTGTLTLDGQGNPNSVFVFQMGSTLITGAGATVALTNGAQACNVFWQVGSSATLAAGTSLVGNVLALASISVDSGETNAGGLYALTGAVTLIGDTINAQPLCANNPAATTTTSITTSTALPSTTTPVATTTTTPIATTTTPVTTTPVATTTVPTTTVPTTTVPATTVPATTVPTTTVPTTTVPATTVPTTTVPTTTVPATTVPTTTVPTTTVPTTTVPTTTVPTTTVPTTTVPTTTHHCAYNGLFNYHNILLDDHLLVYYLHHENVLFYYILHD
ncbi:hypothetical protein A1O1_05156 [Capronia coronata CBS 617.96]|uniref:DUF3494 domain-containing protein n=1 Tax=Capronia coronata CBS 617.96 TaxID=1182541 RepID=W9YG34_9EURO|nr:uncharacterized protein A1O1_05156 [Capronia coronata CBS 617.96]EXJ88226.1 hypothetical protein A1O1_05156 [Capronia coronata CBS 617.96]